jgi:4-O-beta-D-mannosyl-D-glucose phosphorylase
VEEGVKAARKQNADLIVLCSSDDEYAKFAPEGVERIGDVSNVLFNNGWIADEDGTVFIYYASSDTRMHVATSTIERLVDYCLNTPEDGFSSASSVETLKKQIKSNFIVLENL